jgi:hypothetical protein
MESALCQLPAASGVPMQNTLSVRPGSRAHPTISVIIRFFGVFIAAMLVLGLLVRL